LEDHIASIFRVVEKAKQETSMERAAEFSTGSLDFVRLLLVFYTEHGGDIFLRNID
jgi:hypothetical protein